MAVKIRKNVVLLEETDVTATPTKKALENIKINPQVKRDILKSWEGIMKRLEDVMPQNLYKHGLEKHFPNVAMINEIDVVDKETGKKETVRPRQLAELTKYLIGQMVGDPQLQMFSKYFDKPLIHTFAIPTACTDGVRVAVNPLFIDKLLTKEMEETKGKLNGYYIMYVLMHEIYHCVYQHFRRAKIKKETNSPNPRIAELVNIAQDAEINRDLEFQFPEKFKGKTEAIGGVLDDRFKHEVWEDIFDAYYYGKAEPPKKPQNQMGAGGNPKLKNQQGQQGQNQQGQGGGDSEQQDPFEGKSPEYADGFKYALECIENGTLDPLNWDMRVRYRPGYEPTTNFITNYRTKGALGKKTLAKAGMANLQTNTDAEPADMDDMSDVFGGAVDDGSKTFGEELEDAWGTYEDGFTDAVKAVAEAINQMMNGQQNQQGGGGGKNKMSINIPDKYLPKQVRQQLQQQMQQNQQGGGGQNGQQNQQNQQGGQGGGGGQQNQPQAGSKEMGNGAGHFKNDPSQQNDQNGQQGQGGGNSNDQQNQSQNDPNGQQGQGGGNSNGQQDQSQQGQNGQGGQQNQQTYNKDDFEGDAETFGTDHFGGDDIISQEEMQRIAEEAGQPYDTDDLAADPIEKAKDFFEKQKEQLRNLGGGGKQAGSGNGLADLVDKIDDLFKSEIDWRSKLKKFFNGVVESEVKHTYQKRRMGSHNPLVHNSRYIKYNEETDLINDGIAQVFYLIDDSGSMFTGKRTSSGEDYVFTKIFSEIIALEKKTKIHDSMLTYFSTTIVKNKIRHWTDKDNSHKILKLIQRNNDISGGTDIVGCMGAVIKLGKPYYRKEEPQTLMIVITDGYDDIESAAKFEMKYKRKVIWLLINDSAEHRKQQKARLKAGGYEEARILEIDTNNYKKDMK